MATAHAAYHARMLARARGIVVDPDLAEDVVQEAFLRAWQACSSFDPAGGPLVNWLLVITAHTAIDTVKARVRRPPLALGSPRENAPASGISDIDLLILRTQLRHALSSIGAHHRDAVVETVLLDRPYADVAAELGVPPVLCAPGFITGFGGCAACSKPRTRPPEHGSGHHLSIQR